MNTKLYSQACCSAGTPLLGSLEMSLNTENLLRIGLTYDYNLLQSVYNGTNRLNDNTRERLTRSLLLEISYGFSKKISVSLLSSFINQNRTINFSQQSTQQISVNGIGDWLLLLKYNIKNSDIIDQSDIAIGFGLKLPTGKSNILDKGILLPADMQPGSGSFDYLIWGYYSKGFIPYLPLNVIANVSYKINTTHKRFANSKLGYKFGNETIITAGIGYRTDTFLDFSLFFRLRNTNNDVFDDEKIPNTGGTWFYLIPGLNFKISENLTSRVTSQLPIYRNLIGTQLTTTYTVTISLFHTITL
ncbi:hypothetical protein ABRY23_02990 [Melioribacteraceae bacterium 4301-Me]|uniref:hypothetical protein n=1 Tax=Pyranulibacter aquaticus TaxID=3163344 RepID=UPI00359518F1